ncbi:hypothetical protein DM02DRAFT_159283 [Periconia macrospinosa]|uniref:Uncharacterized protein n=1 Tax=Periconia macrospinosa TaxID=97972 RepID=A0A2V1E285_9PLEO|nr:hypothetical protein DM02DRAFT_159283 [Periconia macrospinosa]
MLGNTEAIVESLGVRRRTHYANHAMTGSLSQFPPVSKLEGYRHTCETIQPTYGRDCKQLRGKLLFVRGMVMKETTHVTVWYMQPASLTTDLCSTLLSICGFFCCTQGSTRFFCFPRSYMTNNSLAAKTVCLQQALFNPRSSLFAPSSCMFVCSIRK